MYGNISKSADFTDYLNEHDKKGLLRFITCGSVDDGKSTLIGQLLYASNLIYEDQLNALSMDSKKFGTTGDALDLALLVDGLASEREQGITIDVAYRYFSTDKRAFIVADTPGHEQYTRNMATGASTSMLAIVLIDVRKGILTQTKRHSFILSLFGIKHIILAVNKMDLVHYNQAEFNLIEQKYRQFAKSINIDNITVIPVSALKGDNIVTLSQTMPWYRGPTLLHCLEDIEVESDKTDTPFRMPVQWVNRANSDFRGYAGQIVAGQVNVGDDITILPSGKTTEIEQIILYKNKLDAAYVGQSITLTFKDAIDVSRGDVITSANHPCNVSDQFETTLLWLNEKSMVVGRQYLFKLGTSTTFCTLKAPKYLIDINTTQQSIPKALEMNEIACCEVALDRKIAFEPYEINRGLGAFILVDRMTNATVAAGLIKSSISHSANIFAQNSLINQAMRSSIKAQQATVLWFTGLSGAGKTTLANLIEQRLHALGQHTMLLDGDNIRKGLNRDLGFSESDRVENIRRIAEVAKLMTDAGLITLVSFISPYIAERDMARELIGKEQFLEIFVDAPLSVVEERDPKGLYKKARKGEIKNFTGIDSPYEKPTHPDLQLDTASTSVEDVVEKLMDFLRIKNVI